MMSPNTKKILMIGGAAVAGLVLYKMIKKPAASATPSPPKVAIGILQPGVMQPAAARTWYQGAGKTQVAGIEAALGTSEDLGSLGGSW